MNRRGLIWNLSVSSLTHFLKDDFGGGKIPLAFYLPMEKSSGSIAICRIEQMDMSKDFVDTRVGRSARHVGRARERLFFAHVPWVPLHLSGLTFAYLLLPMRLPGGLKQDPLTSSCTRGLRPCTGHTCFPCLPCLTPHLLSLLSTLS